MSQLPDYIYIPESFKHSTLDFVTAYLDFEEAENSGYEKECLQEYIPSYRHEEGVRDAKKELIDKAVKWLTNNWREYVYQDGDGIIHFGHWESDFRKAMEE